jgi:hypothetical protein
MLISAGCSSPAYDFNQWYVALNGDNRASCQNIMQPCRTIAAVLRKAAAGDTIHIANGWYYENLEITKEIHIIGESMEETVIDGDQNGAVITFRGTDDPDGMDFSLTNLTLTGGLTSRGGGLNVSGGRSVRLENVKIVGNMANDRGGGIFANYAHLLVLDQVQILDNSSVNEGGGIYYIGGPLGYSYYPMEVLGSTISGNEGLSGGGIYADGLLTVSDTLIEENSALVDGGGIYTLHEATVTRSVISTNKAALTGGGLCSEYQANDGNRLHLTETTIDGNHAKNGGGIYNRGEMIIQGSTISNNIASDAGGGIWNGGMGLGKDNYFYSINSTISGNQAAFGGGIWGGEIRSSGYFAGNMELVNLTIANNTGNGIFVHFGSVSLRNVLLADNEGGNCDFTVELEQRNNLSDDMTCGSFIMADPLIGPLEDNGGPTLTHKLLPGSPAIDHAIDTAGLITDQRNFPRPRDGSWDNISDMDIGAYEADYPVAPSD